jgi:hypothetical protein
MNSDDAILDMDSPNPSSDSREQAADALAFIQSLHEMFKSNGMTTRDTPDLNELESIIDSLYGELAACCLFLTDPSFARVPDMLRAISDTLNTSGSDAVPLVVIKGFKQLAVRLENTRVQLQNIVKVA